LQTLQVWTPGAAVDAAPGTYGFSSHGILDSAGYHGPDSGTVVAVALPEGSVAVAGGYADVLQELTDAAETRTWETSLILARRNEPELERFVAGVREAMPARSYAGGVAAYPPGTGEGELHPATATDVLVVLTSGTARSHTIHAVIERNVELEVEVRVIRAVNGRDPELALRDAAERAGVPFDLEHVTISAANGRNVHLANADGGMAAGAAIPAAGAQIRVAQSVSDGLDALPGDRTLAFSCAGLAGAVERPLAPAGGVTAWMFGEIVDLGFGPELGNLMTSIWRSGL
jgi:hypothetical protein